MALDGDFKMRTSHKLTQLFLAASVMVCVFMFTFMTTTALGADPGAPYPATSAVSDQKAGSVLVFNFYTSSPFGGAGNNTQNTRFNITNTNPALTAFIHIFFVAETCAVADYHACLTPNQTATYLVSDYDPAINGYIIVVAENSLGWPASHNFLIGDEYIKQPNGSHANLGAEAFAAEFEGDMPFFNAGLFSAVLNFSGDASGYNKLPATLAASNIPSRVDQNETTLIINRIGGDLGTGAFPLERMFGLLYSDVEVSYSFSLNGGLCQRRILLTDSEPRTTPRFTVVIPAGRTGWMKFYTNNGNIGMVGSMINFNPNTSSRTDVFNGSHNLHKLTLTSTSVALTIPVFPPSCAL